MKAKPNGSSTTASSNFGDGIIAAYIINDSAKCGQLTKEHAIVTVNARKIKNDRAFTFAIAKSKYFTKKFGIPLAKSRLQAILSNIP